MTGIAPNAENFRAEMARHQLNREAICSLIGMNLNLLSMYINGVRKLPAWAAHNIGYAINRTTGIRIFEIEMGRGIIEPTREYVRTKDPRISPRLPAPPRRRRRRRVS